MSVLATAIRNLPDAKTANGAETFSTSKNAIVDLFFLIGGASLKTTPVPSLVKLFEEGYEQDAERAIRILLWLRDIRGGAGRREIFRQIMKRLEVTKPALAAELAQFTPEYGRFDDLLIFQTPEVKHAAYATIARALVEKNGLAAKWMPRKGDVARELREFLELTPKQYRKLLVSLTNVVETQMCAKDWTNINYSHVPSVASLRYAKAYGRHDAARYATWKDAVEKGEAKVNTGALYPHDVVRALKVGDTQLANGVWKQLPNFVGDANILAIADVSGSMEQKIQGEVTAMDVSIALAMYLANKNTGTFANLFMTFTTSPSFVELDPKASLQKNYEKTARAPWGMSTDLQKAFDLILRTAVQAGATQDDMPEVLLILSDMEFNSACNGMGMTNYQAAAAKFQQAGYKLPRVVFWNLASRVGNVPVRYDQEGVALVSGYSPALLTAVLQAEKFTPMGIVDQVIMSDRYNIFG